MDGIAAMKSPALEVAGVMEASLGRPVLLTPTLGGSLPLAVMGDALRVPIIVLPIALMQIAVTYAFFDIHWQTVTARLSESLAGVRVVSGYNRQPRNIVNHRNVAGEYDAFVTVGMLEHVGLRHYASLAAVMRRVLRRAQGRGLLHFIGRDIPRPLNAWILRRIFPGGYPPTLAEVATRVLAPARMSIASSRA